MSMPSQGSLPGRMAVLLLLAGLCLCAAACGAPLQQAPAPGQPVAQPSTLAEFLLASRSAESFVEDSLYQPPPPEVGPYVFQLVREPGLLTLFKNATAFDADGRGLAVALDDGSVRVFGAPRCGGVAMPAGRPAEAVSWRQGAPFLAALGPDRESVVLMDMESCSLAKSVQPGGRLAAVAVSGEGRWLAAADEEGGIFLGPPQGPLARVAGLPSPCLALAFSQGEGILMAAGRAGEVVLYGPAAAQALKGFRAKGGPFAEARFTDNRVEFAQSDGSLVAYDLKDRQPSDLTRKETSFSLKDGILRYRTWYNVPQKKLLPGSPALAVRLSKGAGLFEVRDLDGETRCYGQTDGRPAACRAADDWREAPVDPEGVFCVKGKCGRLADMVFHLEHDKLMCRFVPGQGFHLWWIRTERPGRVNVMQGYLPVRRSIDENEVVTWIPLNPPPDLP